MITDSEELNYPQRKNPTEPRNRGRGLIATNSLDADATIGNALIPYKLLRDFIYQITNSPRAMNNRTSLSLVLKGIITFWESIPGIKQIPIGAQYATFISVINF